ncbi:MAG: hypothetical protein ACOC56_07225 [Atribacterota bacterium]
MSETLTEKLTRELDYIKYKKKKTDGVFLNKEDINIIFETLKKTDKELLPLLETFNNVADKMFDSDHYFVKNMIKDILQYYNILNNDNLMESRHKFYFTESKNLVKKPYLSNKSLNQIKEKFNIYRIFEKVE